MYSRDPDRALSQPSQGKKTDVIPILRASWRRQAIGYYSTIKRTKRTSLYWITTYQDTATLNSTPWGSNILIRMEGAGRCDDDLHTIVNGNRWSRARKSQGCFGEQATSNPCRQTNNHDKRRMQSGEGRCVSRKCAGLQLATQARQVSTKWRWSTRPFIKMPDYILRIRSYYSDGYLKVYLLAAWPKYTWLNANPSWHRASQRLS